MGHRPVPF